MAQRGGPPQPSSDDSDGGRPDDKGGSNRPDDYGTIKGNLYGDLYVIARDADGLPMLFDWCWVNEGTDEDPIYTKPAPCNENEVPTPLPEDWYYYKKVTTTAIYDDPRLGELTVYPGCVQPLFKVQEDGTGGNPVPLTPWPECEMPVDEASGEFVWLCSDWQTIVEAGGESCGEPQYMEVLDEVDFGRTSVTRARPAVLDHAYGEAINALNSAAEITLDEAGRFLLNLGTIDEPVLKTIDSPLENVGMYKHLMLNGCLSGLLKPTDLPSQAFVEHLLCNGEESLADNDLDTAAILLGAAADKAGKIGVDYFVYTNSILGINGDYPSDPCGRDPEVTNECPAEYPFAEYLPLEPYAYNRGTTYSGNVTYLEEQDDGSYDWNTIPIMDSVFLGQGNYTGATWVDPDEFQPLAEEPHYAFNFSQKADDSRAVIEFKHTLTWDLIPLVEP